MELAYYADVQPAHQAQPYDGQLDLVDRQRTLQTLAQLDKPKRFSRLHYEALPGKSAVKEFLADVGTPVLRSVGLGRAALQLILPHSVHYWTEESEYRRTMQDRLLRVLRSVLQQDNDVLLISHGFGSVLAYDCLWRLSHEAEHRTPGRVNTWLTLGSPLADNTVRSRLLGRSAAESQRYPANLINWHNVAAEDDYLCHDETVANDYAAMLERRQLSVLQDHLVYNLAVRYGRSNPHNSFGYLVHPKVATLLVQWLKGRG